MKSGWYCNKISYLSSYVHRQTAIFVLKRVRTTGKRERMCRVKQGRCNDTSVEGHRTVSRGQMWWHSQFPAPFVLTCSSLRAVHYTHPLRHLHLSGAVPWIRKAHCCTATVPYYFLTHCLRHILSRTMSLASQTRSGLEFCKAVCNCLILLWNQSVSDY